VDEFLEDDFQEKYTFIKEIELIEKNNTT